MENSNATLALYLYTLFAEQMFSSVHNVQATSFWTYYPFACLYMPLCNLEDISTILYQPCIRISYQSQNSYDLSRASCVRTVHRSI